MIGRPSSPGSSRLCRLQQPQPRWPPKSFVNWHREVSAGRYRKRYDSRSRPPPRAIQTPSWWGRAGSCVKTTGILTVIRDLGLIVVGLGGIVFQQISGRVNIELLMVYTTILGVPGAIGLLQLSRGRSETPHTAGSSSQSPPQPLSPPESSPPSPPR